jgi:hypothetical protein
VYDPADEFTRRYLRTKRVTPRVGRGLSNIFEFATQVFGLRNRMTGQPNACHEGLLMPPGQFAWQIFDSEIIPMWRDKYRIGRVRAERSRIW